MLRAVAAFSITHHKRKVFKPKFQPLGTNNFSQMNSCNHASDSSTSNFFNVFYIADDNLIENLFQSHELVHCQSLFGCGTHDQNEVTVGIGQFDAVSSEGGYFLVV